MKKIFILITIVALFFVCVMPVSAWLTGYGYRQQHNLTYNTSWTSNLTGYWVKFTVNTSSGTSTSDTIYLNGNSESDLDDLVVTNISDAPLPYWIETPASNPYTIGVNVTTVYNTTDTPIYFYYGKSGDSAHSSFYNTFYMGSDEFSGSSGTTTFITSFSKSGSNPLQRAGSQGWFGVMYNDYDSKFYLAIQNSSPGTHITMFSFSAANVTSPVNWTNHGEVYTTSHAWDAYHIEPHSWVFESQHMADEREGVGAGLGTRQWRLYVCAESAYGIQYLRWGFLTAPESNPTSLAHYSGNPISSTYIGDPKVVYFNGNAVVAQATYNSHGYTTDQDFYYSDDGVEDFTTSSYNWNTENIVLGQSVPWGTNGITLFGGTTATGISEYFTTDYNTKFSYASNPVVSVGAVGSYDDDIYWNGIAINKNHSANISGTYYLFYIGHNSTQDNICLATSTTLTNSTMTGGIDTTRWTVAGTPVLSSGIATINGANERLEGNTKYGLGYAQRARAKFTTYGNYGEIGWNDDTGATTTNQDSWFMYSTPKIVAISSSGGSYEETNLGALGSNYGIWEITRRTGEVKYFLNGTPQATHTTRVTSSSLPLIIGTWSSATPVIDVDWIGIRKLVNPEPGYGAWGAEESSILNANFNSNVTVGYPPVTVQFNDTSTGTPIDFEWIFDQGTSVDSVVQNATWDYTDIIGNTVTSLYVNHSASDGVDKNWENKTSYMVLYPLNTSYSVNTSSGNVPLTVSFTDSTNNGTASAWNWSFGDGNYSSSQNPIFTYNTTGLYNVSLNSSNAYSWDVETRDFYINVTTSAAVPPTSDFIANVTSGSIPLTILFTDNSTDSPTSWEWDIDNSGTVDYITQNCTHTYSSAGNYTVGLNVSNSAGFDVETKSDYIFAWELPTSDFSANVTTGVAPLNVQFSNTGSTGFPTLVTYAWDIDNSGTVDYTTENPTHTYNTPGNYTVNFTITNGVGNDSEIKTEYIHVTENPIAAFSANTTSGVTPLWVSFTNSSTAGFPPDLSFKWDINNDGVTDYTTENVIHEYTVVGNYTVNFTITNPSGGDSEVKTEYIIAGSYPVSQFTSNVTSGTAPLYVGFTNASTVGHPASLTYKWDVDNDGVNDYTTENPTHLYSTPGNYTVNFTVTNSMGSDSEIKTEYIQVNQLPTAAFSANTTIGVIPLTIQFTNSSTAGFPPSLTYKWDVDNDGSIDYTSENPIHTYSSTGLYTVNFTVTNPSGSDSEIKNNYITVGTLPTAAFSSNKTGGTAPCTVSFTSNAISGYPAAMTYKWDVNNDGSTDYTTANVIHTYAVTGVYTVNFTVSNSVGYDSEIKLNHISVTTITPFSCSVSNPTDLDGDGMYEDINGNGRWDWADFMCFRDNFQIKASSKPAEIPLYDFNGNGVLDYNDVKRLSDEVEGNI